MRVNAVHAGIALFLSNAWCVCQGWESGIVPCTGLQSSLFLEHSADSLAPCPPPSPFPLSRFAAVHLYRVANIVVQPRLTNTAACA